MAHVLLISRTQDRQICHYCNCANNG